MQSSLYNIGRQAYYYELIYSAKLNGRVVAERLAVAAVAVY